MNTFSFKNVQNLFKSLDKKTIKLIEFNNMVSIFSCILAIVVMYLHYKFYISRILFLGSITLFKTGILIFICSYIFSLAINFYKEKHT